MEIIQDKALLLRVRNPEPILATLPDSKIVSMGDGVSEI
jgi:hypothetical protein